MINLMKHILFYPNVESILPRSSTEEALKRVETYLPKSKLKSFLREYQINMFSNLMLTQI